MGYLMTEIRDNEILLEIWEEVMAEGKAKGIAEGEAKGEAKGLLLALRGLLQTKFGRVPKWANERLKKADTTQLQLWLSKVIVAQNLEGVIGSR